MTSGRGGRGLGAERGPKRTVEITPQDLVRTALHFLGHRLCDVES